MTDRPLTIEEATKFLEVSDKTVRRMLDRGLLQEQERDRGRIMITAASLNAAAEQLSQERGQADQAANLVLASQTALIKVERERYEALVEAKNDEIRALSNEVTALRTEQQYMVSNDQKIEYERRIASLQASLDIVQQQMTDLKKNPAPRPWWKFWGDD